MISFSPFLAWRFFFAKFRHFFAETKVRNFSPKFVVISFAQNYRTSTLFSKTIEKTIQTAGDISDSSTCAAKTTATGLGIESANSGKKATFTITSRDNLGRPRKRGGDVYAVKLYKTVRNEIKVDVKDENNGTYLAEYTVPETFIFSGQYTLSVCLRGAHIKGSPFVVQVTQHPSLNKTLI